MKAFKSIVFDFNGVFLNNSVSTDQNGIGSVHFWCNECLKLACIRCLGFSKLILSTEINLDVFIKAKNLKSMYTQAVEEDALVIANWATSFCLLITYKFFYLLHNDKLG